MIMLKLLVNEIRQNSRKDTTNKHKTCTVALVNSQGYPNLSVGECFGVPPPKKDDIHCLIYREGYTVLHSAAPLGAQCSYDGKRLACSSMVVGLLINEERSPKVASGRKHEWSPTIHTFVRS